MVLSHHEAVVMWQILYCDSCSVLPAELLRRHNSLTAYVSRQVCGWEHRVDELFLCL